MLTNQIATVQDIVIIVVQHAVISLDTLDKARCGLYAIIPSLLDYFFSAPTGNDSTRSNSYNAMSVDNR